MIWRALVALSSIALVVSGCTSVHSKEEVMAPKTERGFLFVKKDAVKVESAKAFLGAKQVVIGSFKVTFVEKAKAKAKAGGGLGGNGMGGSSVAKLELTGVDDALRMQLTDNAYSDFVRTLQAQGYEVVDRQQMLAAKQYEGVKTYPVPYITEGNILQDKPYMKTFTPTAYGSTMHIYAIDALASGGFAFSNATMAASTYATESKIPVLAVHYTVDFANAELYGNSRWATSSRINVGQGLSVKVGSGLGFYGGQGGTFSSAVGSVKLGQAIYSTEPFGEVVGTTSDLAKGLEVATNILTSAMGSGTNSTRAFAVQADPQLYSRITAELLTTANTTLIETMVSKREPAAK